MVGAVTTLAGFVLLAVVGILVPALCRVRGIAAFFVAMLVVLGAEVVLLTILLSLFEQLRPGWMLAGEAVLALGAVFGWLLAGRPAPPRRRLASRAALVESVRAHPEVAFLAAVAVGAMAIQLWVGLHAAPSNFDSMTYHLSRVGYWLQFDSALHWDNGTVRQLHSPPNGEMLQGSTMLMSGGDRLAASVQWLALVGLWAATFVTARELRFDRPSALFAASLFVVLPQPILQAVTTQNDLLTSFFIVAAIAFGLRGLRDRSFGELAIFALALGVAVGTKGTALVAVPWIALVLLVAAWRARPGRALALGAVGLAVLAVGALGSFNYVLNQDATGSPFGELAEVTERTSPLGDNMVRSAWSFVDTPGFDAPWLNVVVERPALRFFGDLSKEDFPGYIVDPTVNEDTSAYGLLGALALALFLVVAIAPKTAWDRRMLAIAALGFLISAMAVTEQNPWVGRLMMPGVAIGAPLLGYLYARRAARSVVVAIAVVGLIPCVFVHEYKPLVAEVGMPSVLQRTRLDQMTLPRPEMAEVLTQLDKAVPSDAPLGLVRDEDSWDYPLFGPGFERRVVPLAPEQATRATMRQEDIRGIVFLNQDRPEGLDAQPLADGYWFAASRP